MDYYRNISYSISHIFLFSFFYLFVPHRYSRQKTGGICLTAVFTLSATDLLKLNIWPESEFCYVVVTVIQILVTQLTGILISSKRNSKIFFMGLTASNYVIAGSAAATILYIFWGNAVASLTVSTMIHFCLLLFLCIRIRTIWLQFCENDYMGSWWELCLIPVLFYCSTTFTAFFPRTLDENPGNIVPTIFLISTMFVSYVVVLRYVESEFNRSGIYWKNIMFESYIKGLENQYDLVEKSERNLKVMRHDMRHFSSLIDSLLNQKEYDEIKKIIDYVNEVANENKVEKYCDNLIVNTVISGMAEKARSNRITLQLNICIPREIQINAYEFASVVANLLENAILCVGELSEEKRKIDGTIQYTGEHILIEFQNPCEQEIKFDEMTGLPRSSKGKQHGLGMQSILSFSEKTGGNVGCYCEDGMFHIMMFAKF